MIDTLFIIYLFIYLLDISGFLQLNFLLKVELHNSISMCIQHFSVKVCDMLVWSNGNKAKAKSMSVSSVICQRYEAASS